MTLTLTSEEEQLRDSVRRFVADRAPLPRLRELMSSGQPYDQGTWKQLSAQLGLAGLIVPEEHGGAGAGYSALSVALTELGASLVASPLLAVTLAAGTLLGLGDPADHAELLAGIASGELIVTPALWSPEDEGAPGAVRASGDALTGEVSPVLNGAQAQVLLVPAAAGDGRLTVFAVDSGAAGLEITPLTSTDHSRSVARVRLNGTPGRALRGDGAAAAGFASDLANLALASEQLGAMGACLAMTTGYAKIRVAFGYAIGAFQGVKHRLANTATAWELAHAAVRDAARAADERPHDFRVAAAAARALVSPQYLEAATATIQLHGGIGFTWEHDAHLYYKNAIAQSALFGGPGEQLDRLWVALTA